MLRAWLQPPEPMWKLLNWRRAAAGGGGREEREEEGNGGRTSEGCQLSAWELSRLLGESCVCENFLFLLLLRVPGRDQGP